MFPITIWGRRGLGERRWDTHHLWMTFRKEDKGEKKGETKSVLKYTSVPLFKAHPQAKTQAGVKTSNSHLQALPGCLINSNATRLRFSLFLLCIWTSWYHPTIMYSNNCDTPPSFPLTHHNWQLTAIVCTQYCDIPHNLSHSHTTTTLSSYSVYPVLWHTPSSFPLTHHYNII